MASDTSPPIIFVRHGETDWNRQGLIQGSIDTDLNALGHEQARQVASALVAHRSEWKDYQFVVSPQRRALQTAHYVREALEKPINDIDARVRELGFGVWEGKPFWELKASPIYPADPEGRYFWKPEGGESYEEGVFRVNDWRKTLRGPTLVVSHGAVGRCLMGAVVGLAPSDIVELKTPQGAYCRLENGTIEWFDAGSDHA